MSRKAISVAVVGAGSRGSLFGDLVAAWPGGGATVVAVAEPRAPYREQFASRHALPPDRVFEDWRELLRRPRLADAIVIATLDRDHREPAIAALTLGYHLLLEKPMAATMEDCRAIAEAEQRSGAISCVCHSMRYHSGFAALKQAVASGRVGRVASIDQLEQVAWWHQAHSFVRGNWGNEGRSAFMLLAKSCHDLDYIAHLVEAPCDRVSSFGSLSYFTRANAPADSRERCLDCPRERRCAYSAVRHYVDANRSEWPAAVCALEHSREAHLEAIRSGPYGRCVWRCDNDVVDHQVVAMEFEGDVTATFTMTAFTQNGGRKIRIHGTEGEIEFTEERMAIRTFADGRSEEVAFASEAGGHGGGDERVVDAFLRAVREGDRRLVLSGVQESLRTHAIVFAAERSRREGRTVRVEELAPRQSRSAPS